jgi:hypothetical protein
MIMKKKYVMSVAVVLLFNTVQGKDEAEEALKEWRDRQIERQNQRKEAFEEWINSIYDSVTSTNLVLKFPSHQVYVNVLQIEKGVDYWVQPNERLVLTPDCETILAGGGNGGTYFQPMTLKNQQMGFKVTQKVYAPGAGIIINTVYIALSDTPTKVGENDVEMVMEKGKWVTAEESRRLLEIEKLGPIAVLIFPRAEEIQRNPEWMAEVLGHPGFSNMWNKLIEKGYITTNAVEKESRATTLSRVKGWFGKRDEAASREDGQDEEQSKPNNPWLYVGIVLCVLFPLLYFLRKKLKTKT